MDIFLKIAVIFVLIAIGMVLKLAETAVSSITESELSPLVSEGNKRAKRVDALTEKREKFVPSIRAAISTVEFIGAALAASFFAPYISNPFKALGLNPMLCEIIGIVAVTLAFVIIAVSAIAIIARHIALKRTLSVALSVSVFGAFVAALFTPFAAIISVITTGVLRLMSIDPKVQNGRTATEEAIKQLVDTGSEHGTIDSEEKEFIENVFAFDDLTADEIATHRKEITLLWTDETPEEWEKTIYQSNHSYFPICNEKIDNVVGVLSSKEYFRLKRKTKENIMKYAVKSPYFIPESMKANAVLKSMKQKRTYFAVVIDEYGGLSGILTVSDLLQCIVGEFLDEDEAPSAPEIQPLDSKTWMILGQAPISDVEETLDITLDGDFDTFAGYVLTMVDAIPDDGVTFTVENELMTVKVTSIKDHRILKTNVRLKEQLAEENS